MHLDQLAPIEHLHQCRVGPQVQMMSDVAFGPCKRVGRTWARFTGLTLGYGYQPWRALYRPVGRGACRGYPLHLRRWSACTYDGLAIATWCRTTRGARRLR